MFYSWCYLILIKSMEPTFQETGKMTIRTFAIVQYPELIY